MMHNLCIVLSSTSLTKTWMIGYTLTVVWELIKRRIGQVPPRNLNSDDD